MTFVSSSTAISSPRKLNFFAREPWTQANVSFSTGSSVFPAFDYLDAHGASRADDSYVRPAGS